MSNIQYSVLSTRTARYSHYSIFNVWGSPLNTTYPMSNMLCSIFNVGYQSLSIQYPSFSIQYPILNYLDYIFNRVFDIQYAMLRTEWITYMLYWISSIGAATTNIGEKLQAFGKHKAARAIRVTVSSSATAEGRQGNFFKHYYACQTWEPRAGETTSQSQGTSSARHLRAILTRHSKNTFRQACLGYLGPNPLIHGTFRNPECSAFDDQY